MSVLVDLLSQVRGRLGRVNGGTGNAQGWSSGTIKTCMNRTGSTLALGTVVKLLHTWNDARITPTTTASDTAVLGIIVGYFLDSTDQLVELDAPSGVNCAVLVEGTARALTSAAVTRGQYAYTTTTSGQASSSATLAAGAFGVFEESTSGAGLARVVLGQRAVASTTSFGTPAIVLGTAAAAGAATTALRTDATIVAFDATVPANVRTAATGAATVAARRDHVHAASLDNLSDVTITSAAADDELTYNGSAWVNRQRSAATGIWRPLLDGAAAIIVDGDGQAVMAYGPA